MLPSKNIFDGRLPIANLEFCVRPLVFSQVYPKSCHCRSELIDNRQSAIGNDLVHEDGLEPPEDSYVPSDLQSDAIAALPLMQKGKLGSRTRC
jgi:hypothetical protein